MAADYADRIRRFAELESFELKAAGMESEADALLEKAKQKSAGEIWSLDQRGGMLTSEELSRRIARLRDASLSLTLVIGGDEGLAPRVRERSRFVWSLSTLTLPHRLARVLALEQVYRAFEILRGGPYHK